MLRTFQGDEIQVKLRIIIIVTTDMLKLENRVIKSWQDYTLLDSGEGMKLERFADLVVARPDTQTLWNKRQSKKWKEADATFSMKEGKGKWQKKASVADNSEMTFEGLRFSIRLGSFKHIGVFPEQADNWQFIKDKVSKLNEPKVLNLFGHTGVATLAAARAGAFVTHVDASKQSLDLASANATLSGIAKDKVRWIPDDALAFVRRELRRGIKYDGIILDPPAFGRGAKGQVWHIESDLPKLFSLLKEILSDKPGSFLVLNGYAAGYSPVSFAELVKEFFPNLKGTYGELLIAEDDSDRTLPSGIYVRGEI